MLAAESRAIAEDRWTSSLRENAAADHDLAEDATSQSSDDESAGLVLDVRGEMMLAEARDTAYLRLVADPASTLLSCGLGVLAT